MKNTKKGFIVPLLVAIIVVLVIGGGVYYYNKTHCIGCTPAPYSQPYISNVADSKNQIEVPASTSNSTDVKIFPVTTNTKPSITILSPNGGELLEQNTSYVLTWKYTGLSDNDSITIGFRTPNENVCWVGKTIASKRNYSFVPSQIKCGGSSIDLKGGGQFKVQLIVEKYADGQGVADTSDNYFSIVAAGQSVVWKTYTNNQYGFSIKYPQDWALSIKPLSFVDSLNISKTFGVGSQAYTCSSEINLISTDVFDQNAYFYNSAKTSGWQVTTPTINNHSVVAWTNNTNSPGTFAYYVKNINSQYSYGINDSAKTLGVYNKNTGVWTALPKNIYVKECADIFSQMISTLKFIN